MSWTLNSCASLTRQSQWMMLSSFEVPRSHVWRSVFWSSTRRPGRPFWRRSATPCNSRPSGTPSKVLQGITWCTVVTDLFPTGMAENHEIVLFPPLPTLPTCSPRLHQQSPNLLSPRHLLEKQPLTTARDERNRQSQEPKFPRLGREPRPHNKSLVPKKVETEIQINLPLTPQPVVDRWPKSAHLCQCLF